MTGQEIAVLIDAGFRLAEIIVRASAANQEAALGELDLLKARVKAAFERADAADAGWKAVLERALEETRHEGVPATDQQPEVPDGPVC